MKKYIYSFIISGVIFVTAFMISNYFNNRRIDEIRSIENRISMDILSSETQFSLLESASCKDIGSTALSKELNSIVERLSYLEETRGADDPEVSNLKEYYSLLEIKDYLLMQKIGDKCDLKPVSLLYFYSNKGDCEECVKTGYVLTRLREDYPELRIYSFDYNLPITALQTLTSLNKIQGNLPAFLINGKAYYGFHSVADIELLIPELRTLRASSTPATTTPTTTSATPKR